MTQPLAGSCEERMYINKRSGSRRNPARSYTVMAPRLTSVVIRLEMATKTSASTLAPPVIFMRQLRSRSSWLLSSEKRLSITSVCLSLFASMALHCFAYLLANEVLGRQRIQPAFNSADAAFVPVDSFFNVHRAGLLEYNTEYSTSVVFYPAGASSSKPKRGNL